MNNQNETKTTDENPHTAESIDAVELENVTGGCASCGCGQPDAGGFNASQRQAQNFRR